MLQTTYGMEADISARFENLSTDKSYLANLAEDWPGEKPRNPPKIHVGPSATGPAVIADATVFSELRKSQHRAVIGLEMETYGVYCAVRRATRPKTTNCVQCQRSLRLCQLFEG